MAKHWKEPVDPERHRDFMSTSSVGGIPVNPKKTDGFVYFVRECGFTFQFANLSQLETALAYFAERLHAPTRAWNNGLEHFWQKWFERLPAGLNGGPKREKIQKALALALADFDAGSRRSGDRGDHRGDQGGSDEAN